MTKSMMKAAANHKMLFVTLVASVLCVPAIGVPVTTVTPVDYQAVVAGIIDAYQSLSEDGEYVIFKLDENGDVVMDQGKNDIDAFLEELPEDDCRLAAYNYPLGDLTRVFIRWCPEEVADDVRFAYDAIFEVAWPFIEDADVVEARHRDDLSCNSIVATLSFQENVSSVTKATASESESTATGTAATEGQEDRTTSSATSAASSEEPTTQSDVMTTESEDVTTPSVAMTTSQTTEYPQAEEE